MKKIKKILFIAVIAIIVLGLAGIIIAAMSLDKIVKAGIETVAPAMTQTSVTVDRVSLSILSGSAGIHGLVVGNPHGYVSTNAISLGKAAVSVSPGSLLADKIVIRSVEVIAPEVTLEGNPFGENNLKKILDSVNAMTGSVKAGTNTPAAPTAKKANKKIEVDDLLISGVKVHARITGIEGEPFTVVIPDIHFSNLGTGPDGITAADLTQKILHEIITSSISAVGTRAKEIMGKTADNLIKGAGDTAGKAVGESTDKLKQGINNLFGK